MDITIHIMDIYKLYRIFWDFAFDNPEKIKPNHCAVFSFAIEQCNRLGWKDRFGLPTSLVMEATGIKSYSVYKKTFNDLVDFGFIDVVEYSKNQYSSNVIALKENCKAPDKALDKALINHTLKQSESTCESIGSINKQIYNTTNKPYNQQIKDVCEENQNEDFKNSEKEEKEKSSAQKEKEIQEIKSSGFFDQMCNYFSQTTEVMQMRAFGDLVRIYNTGLFEEFSLQTQAYMAYKKISGEKVHRFQNYVYEWQNEDWVNKLKKQHQNGKSNYNNGSNSGYKPASTDTERIIRELESDFANGNIPGQYQ